MDAKDILSLKELFIATGIVLAAVIPVYVLVRLGGTTRLKWHHPPGEPKLAYIPLALFPILIVAYQSTITMIVKCLSEGWAVRLGIHPATEYHAIAATIAVGPLIATVVFVIHRLLGKIQRDLRLIRQSIIDGIHHWAIFLPLTFLTYYIVLQTLLAMGFQHPEELIYLDDASEAHGRRSSSSQLA